MTGVLGSLSYLTKHFFMSKNKTPKPLQLLVKYLFTNLIYTMTPFVVM